MQTLAKYFAALLLFLFTQFSSEDHLENHFTGQSPDQIKEIHYICQSSEAEIERVI
jgi:hypothetical protein